MFYNKKINEEKKYITDGISGVELKKIHNLPEIKLYFFESYPMQSDIYQATFHMVHEINNFIKKYSPDNVFYWFDKYIKKETDFEEFIAYDKKCKYKGVIPEINKSGKTFTFDYSFQDRFFRKDIRKEHKNEFSNCTYAFCFDTIKFSLFDPIYKIKNENNLIVKYPTITSRIVYDSLILYSYIYSNVYMVKLKEDSSLKDSFILYCLNIDNFKLSEVKKKLDSLVKYEDVKSRKIHSIFGSKALLDEEFKKIMISFSKKVQTSVYISLSLVLEIIEKGNDVDSDFAKQVKKLLC